MSGEFEKARISRQARAARTNRPGAGGAPAFVGQVVSPTADIIVGDYLNLWPGAVLGTASEGTAPTLATTSTRTIPAVLLGPYTPTIYDYLIARHEGNRWVVDRFNTGSGGDGGDDFTCIASLDGLGPTLYLYNSYYEDCDESNPPTYYTLTLTYEAEHTFTYTAGTSTYTTTTPAWISNCATIQVTDPDTGDCVTYYIQVALPASGIPYALLSETTGGCDPEWYALGYGGDISYLFSKIGDYCYTYDDIALHLTNNPDGNPVYPP